MTAPTVTSLFSGCGGKDLGFIAAGFRVVWANDIEKSACETYRHNIGPHVVHADIRGIPSDAIPQSDVVIGGFPCQGFSIVGTRRLDDQRNFLYKEFKRVVRDKMPAVFVAENVRGLLNLAGGKVIRAMLEEFQELGYKVDCRLLNAPGFWYSAEHRERVIIVGNRLGLANPFPTPTHGRQPSLPQFTLAFAQSPHLKPYRTICDVIGDIEELGGLPNHEIMSDWLKKKPQYLRIMEHLDQGQKLCNVRLGPRSVYTWNIPEVFGETSHRERAVLEAIAGNRRRSIHGEKDRKSVAVRSHPGPSSV